MHSFESTCVVFSQINDIVDWQQSRRRSLPPPDRRGAKPIDFVFVSVRRHFLGASLPRRKSKNTLNEPNKHTHTHNTHTQWSQKPIRIKIGQGIAGYVAKKGKLVNIRDAYKHPKFFKEVDKSTGFVTKNILCFPIKDSAETVVGVAELVNKVGGMW